MIDRIVYVNSGKDILTGMLCIFDMSLRPIAEQTTEQLQQK